MNGIGNRLLSYCYIILALWVDLVKFLTQIGDQWIAYPLSPRLTQDIPAKYILSESISPRGNYDEARRGYSSAL